MMGVRIRSWFPGAIGLLIGVVVALGFQEVTSNLADNAPAADSPSVSRYSVENEIELPYRMEGASESSRESVSFSRMQWRTLQRERHLLRIDLADCLTWQRTVEKPVLNAAGWGSDGHILEREVGGPDLEPVARFLGLDEPRKEKLREALQRFGSGLREIEQRDFKQAYLGDGTLRITFGGNENARREQFASLSADLQASLGERNAARFSAISGLVPADGYADHIDLKASASGEFLQLGIPGYAETVTMRNSALPLSEAFLRRVDHLELQVDWHRLIQEANDLAPSP